MTEQSQRGGETRFYRALLKPDEHGQVSDEAIAAFVRGLGFDPEKVPKTEAEAERIRRELRRRARRGATDDGTPGR